MWLKPTTVSQTRRGQRRRRDPARSREKILAAALRQFSGKGFTGARVEAIARAAAINKRMLYHYFGSKKGLFREVLRQKMAERAAWLAASPMDPVELLPYWFELACKDPAWVRLLEWEALQLSRKKLIDEAKRRAALAQGVNKIRRRQELGLLPTGLDPRHVLLSNMALTMFPLAFPQITRLVTGCDTADPRFIRQRADFLRRLAGVLYQRRKTNGSTETT
jgi:TetR/AcrR family transcriptional regulator